MLVRLLQTASPRRRFAHSNDARHAFRLVRAMHWRPARGCTHGGAKTRRCSAHIDGCRLAVHARGAKVLLGGSPSRLEGYVISLCILCISNGFQDSESDYTIETPVARCQDPSARSSMLNNLLAMRCVLCEYSSWTITPDDSFVLFVKAERQCVVRRVKASIVSWTGWNRRSPEATIMN